MYTDNWQNLILAGILVSALIWIVQRRSWSLWFRGMLAAALLLVGLVASYFSLGPVTLGELHWYDNSPFKELIVFVLMLAGMVARYLTQAIEARRAKIDEMAKAGKKGPKPRLEFDAWEFAYPFLISVITYGALIAQMNDAAMNIATVTLSFQFGFFWQTVLGTKQKVIA